MITFTIKKICIDVIVTYIALYGNFLFKPQAIPEQQSLSIADKLILFGGLGIAGGWFLIITLMLAPPGVFLALAGAATMFLSLTGKLATRLRTKAIQLESRIKREKVV